MDNQNNLIVYKASAGSGKTFNLVVEYITLLLYNPTSYKTILAVTFTNKATSEMKHRIMSELYGLSIEDEASMGYLNELIKRTNLDAQEIKKRSKWALENIIHDYSYFNIETIDSFFQRVLRNLSRELGLGSSYNLILEDDEIVNEAIVRVIEDTREDEGLKQWYMNMIYSNIEQGKRWNIESELKRFAKNLSNEKFKEFEHELGLRLSREVLQNYKEKVKQREKEIEEVMIGYSEEFCNAMQKAGLKVEDLSYGMSGVGGALMKLRDKNFESILGKRSTQARESAEKWFSKTNQTVSNLSIAEGAFMPILEDALSFLEENIKIYNTCAIVLSNIDNLGLLNDIAKHRREILKEENTFLLSDTASLLARMVDGDSTVDISFIYEKIGTQLKYIMIDEFQDTSDMNWQNFKLLLSESIDNQNRSIIVGDVKQSIYRWRNGDWSILADIDKGITPLQRLNTRKPKIQTLSDNYRTDRVIVEFNNNLFTQGLEKLLQSDTKLSTQSKDRIRTVFADVVQSVKKDKGEVRARFIQANNKKESSLLMDSELRLEIEYYLSKGYKQSDIAVICRKRSQIRELADKLSDTYSVVSDEAFFLGSSKSVRLIIDALRYIVDKNNTLSLCNLKLYFLSTKEVFSEDILSIPSQLDFLKKEQLIKKPIFDLVLYLIKQLSLNDNKEEIAFLTCFIDAVGEYSNNYTSSISDFIKYWDEELCSKSIALGEDIEGIRFLTIHKSKGLEYPVVIVPYCNWEFMDKQPTELWVRTKEGFDDLPILPVKLSGLDKSIMSEDYEQEAMSQYVDNLNVLYVVLTRAEHCLSIISPIRNNVEESINTKGASNVGEFIYQALNGSVEFGDKDVLVSTEEKKEQSTKNIFKQEGEKKDIELNYQDAQIIYAQTKQAEDYVEALLLDDDSLQSKQSEQQLKGIILHKMLSLINRQEDITKAVEELVFCGDIIREKVSLYKEILEKMFDLQEVKKWFSSEYRAMNESSIIIKQEHITSRRPDRIMIKDDQIVILDYKFIKKEDNIEKYKNQLKEYKDLLERMNYKNINTYLLLNINGNWRVE